MVCLSQGHVGSSLPAASQPSSNDASVEAVPKERTRRKRSQRQSKLGDVQEKYAYSITPNFRVSEGRPSYSWVTSCHLVLMRRCPNFRVAARKHLQFCFCRVLEQPAGSSTAASKAAIKAASELKLPRREQKRSMWTVDHIEGTKLWINKKTRPSYHPEESKSLLLTSGCVLWAGEMPRANSQNGETFSQASE